jgi:hypothetical protein
MIRRASRIHHAFIAGVLLLHMTAVSSLAGFPVLMSATNEEVRGFLGASKAKLVYVDYWESNYQLCYVDFSEGDGDPVVHTIAAAAGSKGPKVPVISPDGNWVVYAQGDGGEFGAGVNATSSIYVCRLEENAQPHLVAADHAHEPRWVWNAQTPTIVYPTYAFNEGWEATTPQGEPNPARTMTVEVNLSTTPPSVGTPEVLFQHGGYTGGLSTDGRYLCGGGGLVAMLDLQSGAIRPDTVGPIGFGTDNAVSGQACNASISSSTDHPSLMCYLDFSTDGDTYPGVNGGESWDTWQVIHVTDHTGEPLKSFGYPDNPEHPLETQPTASLSKAKWHHPEWSNHPDFIAATLNADRYYANPSGGMPPYVNTKNQERIYFVNVEDSTYIEIMRQDEATIQYYAKSGGLYWPGLWVDTAVSNITVERRAMRRGGVMLEGDHIASSHPIRTVKIYRADGGLVRRIKPDGAVKKVALRSLGHLTGGTYFVRVETLGGTRVMRYLPMR